MMMKVLVIHDNCSIGGGTNIYRKKLSALLEKKGIETFIFTYAIEDDENEHSYCYHYSKGIRFMRYIKYNYFNLPLFMALRRWIKKVKPDIIHIHHNYIFSNTVLISCFRKAPIVQTVHDYRLLCPTGSGVKKVNGKICSHKGFGWLCYFEGCISLKNFILQFIPMKINKYLLRKVITLFITPSMFLKNALKDYGLEALSIPFGIDYSIYLLTSPPHHQNRVLFIGDLYPSKGVDILLKAFDKVLETISNASLEIVGDGPEKERLEKAYQVRNTIFYGKIPHNEILGFYERANVVILSSIVLENSPLTIYEAMASARPVIGSRSGGIPELIVDGKTGLLFTPGKPEELSEKIVQLLTDKKKAEQMGLLGRKRIETHFNEQKFLNKYLEVFNQLVKDVK